MLRSRAAIALSGAAWLLLVVSGFGMLIRYSLAPGRTGDAPVEWPADTKLIRDPQSSTLVLALHPHCPCSRATITELEQIMTSCQGRLSTQVLFVRPPGFASAWATTDLLHDAAAIPGVRTIVDSAGVEAARFGAFTSGQAALYDANGRLQYKGGITGARGHAGANPGESAVIGAVKAGSARVTSAPVFGCPLRKASDTREPTKERRACPTS